MTGNITHRPTRGIGLTDRFDPETVRATQCLGKMAFATRQDADHVLNERRRKTKRRGRSHKNKRGEVAKVSSYKCQHCGQWHHGIGNRR
jgi:hypothetical protein